MKKINHIVFVSLGITLMLVGQVCFGQENTTNSNQNGVVVTDNRIHELTDRYNRSHEFHGYRIQIISSSKKEKAKRAKSVFASRHQGYKAHEIYQQPFFIIKVGNFLSKLEAEKFHREIRDEFPGSFVLPDIIDPIEQYAKKSN